jgi:hypothetical protein
VIGAKPAAVCRWIFTLLGAAPGDTLDDLFPGSGSVGPGLGRVDQLAGALPPYGRDLPVVQDPGLRVA